MNLSYATTPSLLKGNSTSLVALSKGIRLGKTPSTTMIFDEVFNRYNSELSEFRGHRGKQGPADHSFLTNCAIATGLYFLFIYIKYGYL